MTRRIAQLTGLVFAIALLAGPAMADEAPPPPKPKPAPVKKVEPKPAPAPAKKVEPAPAKKVEPAPAKKAEPAPAKKAEPVPEGPLKKAPNGTFTGVLRGERVAGSIEVVVRGGLLIRGTVHIEGAKAKTFRMRPTDDRDSVKFGLIASDDLDFLRLLGEFVGRERAAGTFKGNLNRKKVAGEWYLVRR